MCIRDRDTIPFLSPILFGHSIVFYFAFALPFFTNYFLKKTKIGLIVRAVGDSPESASNQGINVQLVRILAYFMEEQCVGLQVPICQ